MVYGALVLVAELAFYGSFRVGIVSSFDWWRAPIQLVPVWVTLGWLARRQRQRLVSEHRLDCSIRAVHTPGADPPPWRRGEAVLALGQFTFTRGGPGSVVVPAGPEEHLRIESVSLTRSATTRGIRASVPATAVLRGPDGDVEVRAVAADLVRLRAEVDPAVAATS